MAIIQDYIRHPGIKWLNWSILTANMTPKSGLSTYWADTTALKGPVKKGKYAEICCMGISSFFFFLVSIASLDVTSK